VLVALPLLRAGAVRTRGAATIFVIVVEILLLPYYRDFENAFGHRFVSGYHVHHRVDSAIGPFDEPPTLVITTHADHWYGVATIWCVRLLFVALLFGLPVLTWRALS
jgi:hypothetical protein